MTGGLPELPVSLMAVRFTFSPKLALKTASISSSGRRRRFLDVLDGDE